MLLTFSDDFAVGAHLDGLRRDGARRRALIDVLSNLRAAWRDGHHLIWVGAAQREGLLSLVEGEATLCEWLSRIGRSGRQDLGAMARRVRVRVEITAQGSESIERHEGASGSGAYSALTFKVPMGHLQDSASLREVALLAEDASDAAFYEAMAKVLWYKELATGAVRLHAQRVPGGGDSSADALRELPTRQPVLAVLDSDKAWPEAPVGSTAKKVLEQGGATQTQRPQELITLPCRMLENLLPSALVKEWLTRDDPATLHRACELQLFGRWELRFLHAKKGVRGCEWRRAACPAPGDHAHRHLAETLRPLITTQDLVHPESCPKFERCQPDPKGEDSAPKCDCYLLPRVPSDRVALLLNELRTVADASQRLEPLLFDPQGGEMARLRLDLAQRIAHWLVAGPVQRLP